MQLPSVQTYKVCLIKLSSFLNQATSEGCVERHELRGSCRCLQVEDLETTCFPCCATFVLQLHVGTHSSADEDVGQSVERFYIDNSLQSVPTPEEAKQLVDKLCKLPAFRDFDFGQWASDTWSVILQ